MQPLRHFKLMKKFRSKCCGEPQKCSLTKLGEVAERLGGAGSALFISAGLLHH
jgi:hypothetical protein